MTLIRVEQEIYKSRIANSGSIHEKFAIFLIDDREVRIDLSDVISLTKEAVANLTLGDLLKICEFDGIKATLYPNGSVAFNKLESSTDLLKSCYLSMQAINYCNYLVSFAMDEIQPTIYKVEVLSVYIVRKN